MESEYIKDLYNGLLYINHAEYFKKNINNGRYDTSEGQRDLKHLKDTFIELKPHGADDWKKLNVKKGKFNSYTDLSKNHIYSLYQITEEETRKNELYTLTPKMKEMGDAFLLIKNPNIFLTRIDSALRKSNLKYRYDSVSYYDPNQDQKDLSVFHKSIDYEYQHEFRLIIDTTTKDPLKIDIGSISDISEICLTSQYAGFNFIWPEVK